MPRLVAVTLLHVGRIANMAASVLGQDASPAVSPGAAETPLDLVEVVLLPSDLAEPDFGVAGGWCNNADGMAGFFAMRRGLLVSEVLDKRNVSGPSAVDRRFTGNLAR